MKNGSFQSCVPYVLLANGACDRSWKPVIELLKEARQRSRRIYRYSLLLEEVLGESAQRVCFGSVNLTNKRFGGFIAEHQSMSCLLQQRCKVGREAFYGAKVQSV